MKRKTLSILFFVFGFLMMFLQGTSVAFAGSDIDYYNTDEAVVYTSTGLRTAFMSTNITKIYLGADIKVTHTDIVLNTKSKKEIVLDGVNPYSTDQTIHTLTEYEKSPSSSGVTMRVTSKGTLEKVVVRNIKIEGKNSYGTICIFDGVNNVTEQFDNVTYSGPQLSYNRGGTVIFNGFTGTMDNTPGTNNCGQLARASYIYVNGNFVLNKEVLDDNDEIFWVSSLASNKGIFSIGENANVQVVNKQNDDPSGFIYCNTKTTFEVGKGATFRYKGYSVFNQNILINNFIINDDATVDIQVAGRPKDNKCSTDTLKINGSFVVKENADFKLITTNNKSEEDSLELYGILSIDSPKNFLIYNSDGNAIENKTSNSFDINVKSLAFWCIPSGDPYNLGTPKYLWKNQTNPFRIIATAKTDGAYSSFKVTGYENLTDPLTEKTFNTKGVKVISLSGEKKPVSYAVDFNSNGGTTVPSQTIVSGGLVTKPADPTKSGYTFAGWYKDSGLTTPWNFASDTVTGNTTLYAKWTAIPPQQYVVSFNSNGGTTVPNQTVVSGGLVTKPADPTKSGYTFAGWYKDSGLTTVWNFAADTVTSNTTLYAKWTAIPPQQYVVSFNSNGGTTVPNQTVVSGGLVTKPADPTKSGYAFAGWYKDSGLTTVWNFAADTVTSNTTLYAKWTAIPPQQYVVSFNSNGGTTVPNQTVVAGGLVTKPVDPTKSGYTFAGWYKDSGLTTPWNFASDTVTGNTTLYAKWTAIPPQQYVVSFNSNGGTTVPNQTVVAGSLVAKPADPTKSGYTFAGWYKDSGLTTVWNFAADTVTSNTTLYAKWTAIPPQQYVVSFNSNGGTTVPNQTVVSGGLVAKPADPTKSGYTFAGWYKDSGLTTVWNFASDTVTSNITLYAKWTANPPQQYVVSFNSNGGTTVPNQTVVAGSLVAKPADPTKSGYTFDGWYKDSSLTTVWNFASDTVTTNTTLYAKWTAIPPQQYVVSFDSNGGTTVPNQTVVAGGLVTKPADPTKSGYTFDGWYKDSSLTTVWNFASDTVTTNTTLYAKWTAIPPQQYVVSFDSNGGTTVPNQTVVAGGLVTKPADPTKSGYTFDGWYKDSSLTTPWNFASDTVTTNTTLYAKWTAIPPQQYVVSFDSNGGSSVPNQTVVAGGLVTKPTDPTKSGYIFDGWYKDSGLTSTWDFASDTVTSDTTLYAKWINNNEEYIVTFESNGGSSVPSQSVPSGGLVKSPANPTKEGNCFLGWYLDEACTIRWNFARDRVYSDMTLYALWYENC